MPRAPPRGLGRWSCSRGGRTRQGERGAFRRPRLWPPLPPAALVAEQEARASSGGQGVLQPHGAVSRTYPTLKTGSKDQDTHPLSQPPGCPSGLTPFLSKPPAVTPSCFCRTEDQAPSTVPATLEALHTGPVRKQGQLHAVSFTPGPRRGSPSGRKGGPTQSQAPRVRSSASTCLLHLWTQAIHSSLSPGLAGGRADPGVAQPQQPARGRPRPSPAQSLRGPTRRFPAWSGASVPRAPGSIRSPAAGLRASTPIHTGRPVHAAGCQQGSDVPSL